MNSFFIGFLRLNHPKLPARTRFGKNEDGGGAEHLFGTIKRWFGYTHFLLKGLEKVRTEWGLTTMAYNL